MLLIMDRNMRKFTISLLFAFCLVLGKQTHGSLMISGFSEEVNNPFLVPSKFVLPSGTPIYLSYLAALKDAQEHHKVGLLITTILISRNNNSGIQTFSEIRLSQRYWSSCVCKLGSS